jgi:hypothetical protein
LKTAKLSAILVKNQELEVVDFCKSIFKIQCSKTITSFQKVERLLQHSSLEEELQRKSTRIGLLLIGLEYKFVTVY